MLDNIIEKLVALIDFSNTRDARNIERELQRRALKETAIFVENYMYKTRSFPDKMSLLKYSVDLSDHKGLFIEFGVYKGDTLNYIASNLEEKIIYGFDSFDGLPEDWRDGFQKGVFELEELPEVKENVELVKGWFEDTLPEFVSKHPEKCSFIHIDCDLYSSTKTIFKYLGEKIEKNTVIVFDEFFNYPGWKNGEFKALMEFIELKHMKFEYVGYCRYDEQVAIRISGE